MRKALSVRLLAVLALAGLGAGLPGCSTGSPLHSRYNNFRAYYNTYYNASQSLEEGERALERSAVTVDRNQLVSVFPVTASTQTSGPFQDAIDKSAELLRSRATSKWADDALMVIGKAYFYQRNFVGAEQKFRETMAAAELVEDRRLGDEARFWLGRTYASANRFDDGVLVLEEGLADEGGDRFWRARMQLALGELYARAGRWDEAAGTLREGAPEEGDADIAARAFVLLGQVEEHAERWDEAAAAYTEALRRRPDYELSYAAEVGRALVVGIEAGRTDEALAAVRAMRSDDKNYDRRGELALVEARLRAAAGETQRARSLFRDVLYDEALAGQRVRGETHYRLAELYRDAMGDYVLASAHFDTAATALRAPISDVRPSRGAILDVADEARTYNALAETARRIAEVDSLLALGALSDEDFRARIEEIEAERRRVFIEEQRRLDAARTAQAFSGSGGLGNEQVGGGRVGQAAETQAQQAQAANGDAGFLAHRVPASVQAGLIAFEQTWGDRPLVPNWRRRAALQAGDAASARGVIGNEVARRAGSIGGPPPLDLSSVPRTPARRAEAVASLAGLRYELANAFFLSINRADTAAALYRTILAETPDLPVAVRARYALAEIEREAGRDDVARPLYEAVAAADSSALRQASLVRLGRASADEGEAVVETSAAYDAARRLWVGGDPLAGAEAFVALGDANPDDADAPRAYLAAAVAYVEWAGRDSLALVRPFPDSLVSTVLLAVADSLAQIETAAALEAAALEAATLTIGPDADETGAETPEADDLEENVDPVSPSQERRILEEGMSDDVPRPLADPDDLDLSPEDRALMQARRQVDDEPLDDEVSRPRSAPAVDDDVVPRRETETAVDDEAPILRRNPAARRRQAPAATPVAAVPPPSVEPPSVLQALPVPDSTSFTLRHHLRGLVARYPGSPYAERATGLIARLPALPEIQLPVLSDTLRTDSLSVPDGLEASLPDSTVGPADSVQVDPDDSVLAEEPVEETLDGDREPEEEVAEPVAAASNTGLRSSEPIDPSLGGFTWRVRTLSIPDEGTQMVRVLKEAGFRAAILRDEGNTSFTVALGQFDDVEQAEAARDGLPAWARLRGEVIALSGFTVVPENDVDGP
ncbi:MAG: hypothetical protein CMM84_15740 [Rhodothermaceae bacterium]|nr:hypothetical protein [Rhodothermaceae bacterium]